MIWAIVRFQKEGYHRWAKAPQDHFLKNLHRHIFYVEVWIEQRHDDRDIEYIQFKRLCQTLWELMMKRLNESFSCEMAAGSLKGLIENRYKHRKVKVGVFEDNENGVLVE